MAAWPFKTNDKVYIGEDRPLPVARFLSKLGAPTVAVAWKKKPSVQCGGFRAPGNGRCGFRRVRHLRRTWQLSKRAVVVDAAHPAARAEAASQDAVLVLAASVAAVAGGAECLPTHLIATHVLSLDPASHRAGPHDSASASCASALVKLLL